MIIDGTPENDNLMGTAGNDTITGLDGNDLLEGIAGDDSLEGGVGDDSLEGGAGNDTLSGAVGDNILNGGDGDDLISFGAGENIVNGGDGIDSLNLNFADSAEDIVFTYNVFEDPSPTSEGIFEGTTIESIEQVDFVSGSGNDLIDIATASVGSSINGGAGDDALIGGLGDDSISGEEGNDTFFGAGGNNEIVGGEGNDAAVFVGLASDYEVVLGETLTAVTLISPETPSEDADDEETDEETTPAAESSTDTLSEVEVIIFENGEITVETGEFLPFADSPDGDEVPVIEEGSDEDLAPVNPPEESELSNEDGVPVYRFFRTDTQTQFYTTEEVERDSIIETLPSYDLEGISFVGVPNEEEAEEEADPLTGTSPVYRFFNTSTGIHLYTADENERDFVTENLENYVAEGSPYSGYDTQVEGTVPLYRFYNEGLDAHFYTPSTEERDTFIESPDFEPEGGGDGIAFYVEPSPEL